MIRGFVLTFLIVTVNSQETLGQNTNVKCKPLQSKDNISCKPPLQENSVRNNCTTPQTVGTVAYYSCKPYFVHAGNSKDGQLLCLESGEWSDLEEFDQLHCIEDCGRRSTSTNPEPGNATNPSLWPWHAMIFRKSPETDQWVYTCGGTIVEKSAILTAAHCVTDEFGKVYSPQNFMITLGNTGTDYLENRLLNGVQIFQVQQIYVSEYYDPRKEYQGDIALIHLDGDINYTNSISPVCLPTEFSLELNEIKAGSVGHVVGHAVDDGSLSGTLRSGTLEVKSHSECFIKLQRTLAESQFCAGDRNGTDGGIILCNGDSGGGLFSTTISDDRYQLRGIVSTGDADFTKGICKNYAVFTRIFPFIFWIRDVIQRINGEAGTPAKIGGRQMCPFIQTGRERTRLMLKPIPREWKNRVTEMTLENVDVNSDALIKSLEHSRSLQSINFTRVRFLNTYHGRKVILPLLSDVYLDILADYPDLTSERIFPELIRKEFLDPFIFFSKSNGNRDMGVECIVRMNINIEIRMHIFKLIRINHPLGLISLSQIPFANEILNNSVISKFELRQLALSKCVLNVTYLEHFPEIEKLVLDNVAMDSTELFQILPTLIYLKELTLVGVQDTNIYVVDLPISLSFLSLTDTVLSVNIMKRPVVNKDSDSNIPYELSERWRNEEHPNSPFLETFYCNHCLVSVSAVENLEFEFPSLKQIWINTNNHQRVSFLDKFKNLEVAFLGSKYNKVRIFRKTKTKQFWQAGDIIPKARTEMLDFRLTRLAYFWTSEGDYRARTRLNSNEIEALKSGKYYFNGTLKILPDGTSPILKSSPESTFTQIPFHIQDRIHTLEIEGAEVTSDSLVNSLGGATNMRSDKLTNIYLQDAPRKAAELQNLEEYSVHTSISSIFTKFTYPVQAQIRQYLFIDGLFFKEYLPGTKTPLDYQNRLLSSRVKKIFGKFGNCVVVSWNQETGELVSDLQETNAMLKNYEKSDLVKKFSYKYWPLDAKLIPKNISHLNLNFAVVDLETLLVQTKNLEDLRLINVRVNSINTPESYRKWEWPLLSLKNLIGHSETLKYLAVERAHIQGWRNGYRLSKLKTLILESCTLEPKIIQEFSSIFPNVEEVVILGSSPDDTINFIDDAADRILISALIKSEHLRSIQGRVPLSSGNQELRQILSQRGCNMTDPVAASDSTFFTLNMVSNEWECTISSMEQIENNLLEKKGLNAFGIQPECHAYNFYPISERHAALPVSEELIVEFLEQWKNGSTNLPDVKLWLHRN